MTKPPKKERDGLIHLDADKLKRQMIRRGLTNAGLADKANISRNSVIKALKGGGVFPSTGNAMAEAVGLEDATSLLPPTSTEESSESVYDSPKSAEWEVDAYEGPWITASNGLQYRICRMVHQFVKGRLGRGKYYDLLDPSSRTRENLRHQLVRHAVVCERIGSHPNVAENVSATPGNRDDSWWVIDRWIAGETLASRLVKGQMPSKQLPRLMKDIAQGLKALHEADVVFRELSPSRVIIADSDDRAVLTDFELAKLLESQTVSSDWPDDPYRSPEVETGTATASSDLYSWARILLHTATGELPAKGRELDLLMSIGLPKSVWRMATDCLSPGPSQRPKFVDQILKAMKRWSR